MMTRRGFVASLSAILTALLFWRDDASVAADGWYYAGDYYPVWQDSYGPGEIIINGRSSVPIILGNKIHP